MTVLLRDAVAADTQALRELFLRARLATFVWQPENAFQLADFDAQTKGERLTVAEDSEGRLVGFVSVWEPDDFIHHIYVEQTYLRRGIGKALLHTLPGWPARCYRLKCVVANKPALVFYHSCGFIEIGAGQAPDGDYLVLESRGESW